MSGLDVLQRLRAAGNVAGVVMVTAERDADAVRAALHGGAMQYLVKPFEYADLAARLLRVRDTLALLETGEADQEAIDRAFGTGSAARTSRCRRVSARRPPTWSAPLCGRRRAVGD